ncbi:MAG TPA: NADPH-dependent FMN reductase [Candidatus Binataceae bacterium]|nr:NADPH-dependent FMN reductase [Candidatus Binataceae bacterium]
MAKLTAIVGSVTPPGRLLAAVTAMVERARAADPVLEASVSNLADVRIAFADGRAPAAYGDDTAAVVDRVAGADLVIFATPVYRASFTGALKNLIDHLPVEALMGKPCGIIAMGATAHHFLSVEWHLRDVLTWFGAIVAPTGVYLSAADFTDGALNEGAAAELDLLVDALSKLGTIAPGGGRPLGPFPLAARRR